MHNYCIIIIIHDIAICISVYRWKMVCITYYQLHVQDGQTPLYIASRKGHGTVLKLLLKHNADISICKTIGIIIIPLCVSGSKPIK